MTEKTLCRTPNQPGGGKPCHIDTWKFELLAAEIRAVLTEAESMGFMALMRAVREGIPGDQAQKIGSVGWFTTTVLLELEYRGDLIATKVKGTKTLALT